MNNYILFDGKKYKTSVWGEQLSKAVSARLTLRGELDVTYGASRGTRYQGIIEAPVTPPDSSWGSPSDLRTSMAKTSVSVTDHFGNSFDAAIVGAEETSLKRVLEDSDNIIFFKVELIEL